jgi:hypothetical protein
MKLERHGFSEQKPYFLAIPSNLFYFSCFISLFCIMIAGRFKDVTFKRIPDLDSFTYWFDPIFLHLIAIFIIFYLIVRYRLFRGRDIWSSIIGGLIVPVSILFFELFLEKAWLEATFDYPIIFSSLPDAFMTSWMAETIGISSTSSIPCGFCIRQTWLLLFIWGIIKNVEIRCSESGQLISHVFSGALIKLFKWLSLLFLVIISALRIYRGHSNFLDIGIAFGVGTFLFWFGIIIYNSFVAIIFKHEAWQKGKEYITFFGGYTALIVCSFYFYSHEATQWVFSSLIIFLFIGICYVASSWIGKRSPA